MVTNRPCAAMPRGLSSEVTETDPTELAGWTGLYSRRKQPIKPSDRWRWIFFFLRYLLMAMGEWQRSQHMCLGISLVQTDCYIQTYMIRRIV